jgi:hypothetical protein
MMRTPFLLSLLIFAAPARAQNSKPCFTPPQSRHPIQGFKDPNTSRFFALGFTLPLASNLLSRWWGDKDISAGRATAYGAGAAFAAAYADDRFHETTSNGSGYSGCTIDWSHAAWTVIGVAAGSAIALLSEHLEFEDGLHWKPTPPDLAPELDVIEFPRTREEPEKQALEMSLQLRSPGIRMDILKERYGDILDNRANYPRYFKSFFIEKPYEGKMRGDRKSRGGGLSDRAIGQALASGAKQPGFREAKEPEGAPGIVKAEIAVAPLRYDMLQHGLRKPGSHWEMSLHYSHIKGGNSSSYDAGGGAVVNNQPFTGDLVGGGVRYYWNTRWFGELSGMGLTHDSEIGEFISPSGQRSSIMLIHYTPVDVIIGRKFIDKFGLRGSAFLGHESTLIDWQGTPLTSREESQHTIQNWIFGGEAQWVPLKRLGIGIRAEYLPKAHFDAITEKMVQRWRVSEQLLFWF